MPEPLLNKVTGLKTCNFIKKRHQHRSFSVKFAKFLKIPSFYGTFPVAASDLLKIIVLNCFMKRTIINSFRLS